MITERMRHIDGDLKKSMDDLNEVRNQFNQLNKGNASGSFLTKDLGDVIYNSHIDPDAFFVEKVGAKDMCFLSTFIAIIHKTKFELFK